MSEFIANLRPDKFGNLYGSLDLEALWEYTKSHPEDIKEVELKDGTKKKYLQINVNEMKQESKTEYKTHYIKVLKLKV
jgi:hypothetical protein